MGQPKTFRTLSPSDFSFYGFDDLSTAVEDALRDVGIRGGPLETSVVDDVIFVPSMKLSSTHLGPGRTAFEGSLVTRDGQGIDFAQARRRTLRWGPLVRGRVVEHAVEQTPIVPGRTLDEEVVYLGWLLEHYGHFLSESLCRTWLLDEIDPKVKVVFHRKKDFTPSGTRLRILEMFGIPLERIIFLEEPTLLRRVIVPEPLHELHWSIHERSPRKFRQVAAQILTGVSPSEQPVYLSRRLLPSSLRQIVGELELEEMLRENGFLIAYPETMSFSDQVRLFNQHTDIFASAGSAAYTMLFSLNRPALHFLTAEIPRQDYFLLPAVTGAAAAYCNGLSRGGRPSIKTTPLLANLPTLGGYLEAHGFLKKRLRASLATRVPKLAEEFDEAWFCATVRDIPHGERLSPDIEHEALSRADASWPLSWVLAHYQTFQDVSRVDELVRQFIELVGAEHHVGRLARYHNDVKSKAPRVVRKCGPEVSEKLITVLSDRFHVVMPRGDGDSETPRPDRRWREGYRNQHESQRGRRPPVEPAPSPLVGTRCRARPR